MIEAAMASICVISVIAGASWVGGLLVFAPLHERTLLFTVQNRFRIADVISLGVLLQIPVAAVLALIPEDAALEGRITSVILISLIVLTWWINGLRMLSRAGVESGLHRAAFLILLLPTGYLSVLVLVGTIVLLPAAIELIAGGRNPNLGRLALGWAMLLSPLAAVVWGITCNRICRSMANRARDEQAKRDGISFDTIQESQRDLTVVKYVIGRQKSAPEPGIQMQDPVTMATSADPPEPVEGLEILDEPEHRDTSD